jgi:hypothetical protein
MVAKALVLALTVFHKTSTANDGMLFSSVTLKNQRLKTTLRMMMIL